MYSELSYCNISIIGPSGLFGVLAIKISGSALAVLGFELSPLLYRWSFSTNKVSYVLNNYAQSIQHLPGVNEIDSFKMLSRRAGRTEKSNISFNTNK